MTETLQVVESITISNIVVVGVMTHCALLHIVYDLEAA